MGFESGLLLLTKTKTIKIFLFIEIKLKYQNVEVLNSFLENNN